MRAFLLLALLLPLLAGAQKAQIRILHVTTTVLLTKGHIAWPVVEYPDAAVAARINAEVRRRMLGASEGKSLKTQLKTWGEGVSDLSHSVTYNDSQLLSFQVYVEGCGAYCSSYTTWFNFDLRTGKALAWTALFAQPAAFEKTLSGRIARNWNYYRKKELPAIREDSNTIGWAMEEIAKCPPQVAPDNFALYPDRIEFYTDCHFPHVIRSLEPDNSFRFTRGELNGRLRKEFLARLFR